MNRSPEPVASLKGLGPKSAAALRRIGIATIEQLRERDAFEVYALLKANGPGTSVNFLYAIIGAIEDVQWREVKRTRRTEILLRLDQGPGHAAAVLSCEIDSQSATDASEEAIRRRPSGYRREPRS
ncbi:MAG: TfoX/Sxy family DNA transformation protein [Gammaproteobacteria bacterium]